MTVRCGVLSCFTLLFCTGVTFAESTFIAAVRHGQQMADAGQYDAAVHELEESVKRYEGSGDPRTLAIALNELGRLYTDLGRPLEAKKSLARSVDLFQQQLGVGCQQAQEALINLSDVYMMEREFARAQKLLEQLVQIQTAIVDQMDGTRGAVYTNLANVHLAQGHTAEAEQWASKAIQVLTHEGVPSPIKIAAARETLGLARAAGGDTRGAISQVSETVAGLEHAGFSNHPEIVPYLLNLGGLYMQLQEWSAAEIPLDRALAIVVTTLGTTHPWRADALTMLSKVYRESGRRADAKRAMKSAESISAAYRGQNALTGVVSIDELRHR